MEERGKRGTTALHRAALHGHAAEAEWLLLSGDDVGRTVNDGRTALLYAARHGHVALVGLLLESGADVDGTATDGSTPLHEACGHGHLDVAETLLRNGADGGKKCDGETPLDRVDRRKREFQLLIGKFVEGIIE
jgi:ankyrin repeat protein